MKEKLAIFYTGDKRHNLEVVKSADWVIDIGPAGGDKGGNLVFEGTPEDLAQCKDSITGPFLLEKLA